MPDPRAFITLSDIKKVAGAGEATEGFSLSSITSLIKDIADMIKSADSLVGNVTGRASAATAPAQSGSWAPQSPTIMQKPMMPTGEEIAGMAIAALEMYKLQKGDVPISQVIAELKGDQKNEIQEQGKAMGLPGIEGDGKNGAGEILSTATT